MRELRVLVKRNCKLFFKDKGMFFTSLVTPLILLVLYATFLSDLYKSSFLSSIPENIEIKESVINSIVCGQLISSLLAVSCVTVAFCSNLLMVNDKISGARRDLLTSSINPAILSLSYFIATAFTTFIVCFFALCMGFIYFAIVGWFLTVLDVFALLLDIVLLVLFGTALSSIINSLLSTNGQVSAVGTIVSAGYGFICGAYMPMYSFAIGLQRVLSFLPGTYGTSLLRMHCMRGGLNQLASAGIPSEAIEQIKNSVDCNVYFFNNKVEILPKYLILIVSTIVLIAIYVLMCNKRKKKISKQ